MTTPLAANLTPVVEVVIGTGPLSAAPATSGINSRVRDRGPSADFLACIPHEYARRHLILSAGDDGGVELLLIADQTGPTAIFNVGVRLRKQVKTTKLPADELATAIDRASGTTA